MRFTIVTAFPKYFESPLKVGQVSRAIAQGTLEIEIIDLREFSPDNYGHIDDKCYGGGGGMLLQLKPLVRAVEYIESQKTARESATGVPEEIHFFAMTPSGKMWDQRWVEKYTENLSTSTRRLHIVIFCGRYEGFDQRFLDYFIDLQVSVGPYVLNGGEAAAWVVIESLARFLPQFVGNQQCLVFESFSMQNDSKSQRLLDHPQYTMPSQFRGMRVPQVLRSGDHKLIAKWRQQQSLQKTQAQEENHFTP